MTHDCDFIIKVEKGIAYHEGRFGPNSEVEIFKEPLYSKNTNKEDINKNHKTIHDELWEEIIPYPHNPLDSPVAKREWNCSERGWN